MTNETSESKKFPTELKEATSMGEALVASRCCARGLHPGLRVHAIPGSCIGLPVAFGLPSGEVEWEDNDPDTEAEKS